MDSAVTVVRQQRAFPHPKQPNPFLPQPRSRSEDALCSLPRSRALLQMGTKPRRWLGKQNCPSSSGKTVAEKPFWRTGEPEARGFLSQGGLVQSPRLRSSHRGSARGFPCGRAEPPAHPKDLGEPVKVNERVCD